MNTKQTTISIPSACLCFYDRFVLWVGSGLIFRTHCCRTNRHVQATLPHIWY